VIIEMAVAFVLLTASGLMLRSLARLLDTDTGLDARNVLTARVTLPESVSTDAVREFWQRLLERTSSIPGVASAAISDCPPLLGVCNIRPFWSDAERRGAPQPAGVHWVSADYFHTLRVPALSGRLFDARDRAGTANVVVINDAAARRYFPIVVGGGFAGGAEIIGVVGNQRFQGIEVPAQPDVYIVYDQVPQHSGFLFLRAAGDPAALAPEVRRAVHELDPDLPVYDVQTMEQRVGIATARTRVTGMMLALFAAVALLLALIGIYGVVSYAVMHRTREIGVRIALGAPRANVAALVLRHSATLAGLGLAIGLAGAWTTTRVLRSLLYEVEPTDPRVLVPVAFLLMIAAFVASLLPLVRAVRTDPVMAMKFE
jgi:predicted permease